MTQSAKVVGAGGRNELHRGTLPFPSRLAAMLGACVLVLCAALFMSAATPARAVQPDEILSDAALEKRARDLSLDLRCLVCQNQSIDDSDAPLARDLRLLVRERLTAGDTDEQVRAFLVARYGDFVLLKPPLRMSTLLLWLTPVVVLLLAGFILWRQYHRPALATSTARVDAPLSAEEERRLAELLGRAETKPPRGP